ncbi:hypothetical protein GF406_27035 [candidate division KSB1 bacterium]|nr:hypothetical protein [candidate division KSB1 bacterium]
MLSDDVLKNINEHVVQATIAKKLTRGSKLRVDSTAVEANIHYPTDSNHLNDCIKVISRLGRQCRELGLAKGEKTRDFTRSAKKHVLNIVKYSRKRSEEGKQYFTNTYHKLVQIAKRCKSNAVALIKSIPEQSSTKAKHIKNKLEQVIPTTEQVIKQTECRVLKNEHLSSDEKILSIHQPDTYTIRKGKRGKPNEFGKALEIQQTDGKIITHWTIHESNVSDTERFVPAIKKHIETFGKAPHLATGDRVFRQQTMKETHKN